MIDFSLTIYSESSYNRAMEVLISRSLVFNRSQSGSATIFEIKGTVNDYLEFQQEIEAKKIHGSLNEMA